MDTMEQIYINMIKKDTLLCCGLDPDIHKLPSQFLNSNRGTKDFLESIVDIVSPHVCAYKIQKAFFDVMPTGHETLKSIIQYIHKNHPEIPVILDCKIGDIDNTMKVYLENIFDNLKCDGVVVNPYMGDDVFEFLKDPNKAIVVLVKTSNPGADVLQKSCVNGKLELWEFVLDLCMSRWNKSKNIIPVLSANYENGYKNIRKKIGQKTLVLLAGMGAQGGDPNILKQLLNDEKLGVFVNSSRALIYPEPTSGTWEKDVLAAVVTFKKMLNDVRKS